MWSCDPLSIRVNIVLLLWTLASLAILHSTFKPLPQLRGTIVGVATLLNAIFIPIEIESRSILEEHEIQISQIQFLPLLFHQSYLLCVQPNTWPYPLSPLYSLPFRGQEAGSWRKTEWENIFTKVFSKSTITKGRLLEYNLSVVELDIKCIIKIEVILNNNAFKWYWSDIMNQVAIICDVSQHVQFSCPMYCTWLLFWKHHWQLSITHWHISEFQCSTK